MEQALGQDLPREQCPDWLTRPGLRECGSVWSTVQQIYSTLTGGTLPEEMPPRERRSIDAVLTDAQGRSRIVEVDETQHFSPARARTLELYPPGTLTAFDTATWTARSLAGAKPRGGGYARPRPPLFPEPGGRHLQRAFRDALADLVPAVHGWAPTLRIGDFEVDSWLYGTDAVSRMRSLLADKGLA
jgi:hypothetical protein